MSKLNLEKNKVIEITVIPNAKTENIQEISENHYKIRVTEKPIKDKANKNIIDLFKKKGYEVKIIKGQKSSKKLLKIINHV